MSKTHLYATFAVAALCGLIGIPASAQDNPRQLYEAGKFQATVDKTASDGAPASQYLKGLSHLKLNQPDAAKEAFQHLEGGDEAWKNVGRSAVALVDNDRDTALAAANAAVAANGKLTEAQYQLGLVLEASGNHQAAAEAFVKATESNPQMAYAHYNAAMSYYEAKRVDKMAVYFENFLKLAPNAPERPAVESIMKTVRGK